MTTTDARTKCLEDDHAFDASTLHRQLDAFDDWFGEKCEAAHDVTSHHQTRRDDSDSDDSENMDDSFALDDDDDDGGGKPGRKRYDGALEEMFRRPVSPRGGSRNKRTPPSASERTSSAENNGVEDARELDRIRRLRQKNRQHEGRERSARHGRTVGDSTRRHRSLDRHDTDEIERERDSSVRRPRSGRLDRPSGATSFARRNLHRGTHLSSASEHGSKNHSRRTERRSSLAGSSAPVSAASASAAASAVSASSFSFAGPSQHSSPSTRRPTGTRSRRRMSVGAVAATENVPPPAPPTAAHASSAESVSPKPAEHKRSKSRDRLSASQHRRARNVGRSDELRDSSHDAAVSRHRRSAHSRRLVATSSGELSRNGDASRRSHRRSHTPSDDLNHSEHRPVSRRSNRRIHSSTNDDSLKRSDHSTGRRPASDRILGEPRKPDSTRRPVSTGDIYAGDDTDDDIDHSRHGSRRRMPSSATDESVATGPTSEHRVSRRRGSVTGRVNEPTRRSSDDSKAMRSASTRHRRRHEGDPLAAGSEHTSRVSAGVRSSRTPTLARTPRSRENLMRRERSSESLKRVDSGHSPLARAQARRYKQHMKQSTGSSERINRLSSQGDTSSSRNATWDSLPKKKPMKQVDLPIDLY